MKKVNNAFDQHCSDCSADDLNVILSDENQKAITSECRNGNDSRKTLLKALLVAGYPDMDLYAKYCREYDEILAKVPEAERKEWLKKKENKKKGERTACFLKPTGLYLVDLDHIDNPRELFQQLLVAIAALGYMPEDIIAFAHVTARGHGIHVVMKGRPGSSIEKEHLWIEELIGVKPDPACKDLSRLMFVTIEGDVLYRNDKLLFAEPFEGIFENDCFGDYQLPYYINKEKKADETEEKSGEETTKGTADDAEVKPLADDPAYYDIPYSVIVKKFWDMYYNGEEPIKSNRNTRTFELAVHLRNIAGYDRDFLDRIIPSYDGFSHDEKMKCIDSALSYKRSFMPMKLRKVLDSLKHLSSNMKAIELEDENFNLFYVDRMKAKKLGMAVKASLEGISEDTTMAVLTSIAPYIGGMATDVQLSVHGVMKKLNLLAFIEGSFGSGKSQLTALYEIWCAELLEQDKLNAKKEDEWETLKREAEGSDKQPKEQRLPRRCATTRTTLPKIMQRMRDALGKHLITHTPESDTLSQNRMAIEMLKLLLRYAYDGDSFSSDVKSVNSTNTTIEHVLWNVTLCGTKDALYRLITEYLDGLLSRFCIASMPSNLYKKFTLRKPRSEKAMLTIRRVAHLLPLMKGDVFLPKLEARAIEWVDNICEEAEQARDATKAALRIRTCVSSMRYTCCFMLLQFAEYLLRNLDDRKNKPLPQWADGCETAESFLIAHEDATAKMLPRFQSEYMLEVYECFADYFLDNALYYFRERIEKAQGSVTEPSTRTHRGKNDAFFSQLGKDFTLSECVCLRDGNDNAARMMIRNWESQGLIKGIEGKQGLYQKV